MKAKVHLQRQPDVLLMRLQYEKEIYRIGGIPDLRVI
jgi:hypothetical protein